MQPGIGCLMLAVLKPIIHILIHKQSQFFRSLLGIPCFINKLMSSSLSSMGGPANRVRKTKTLLEAKFCVRFSIRQGDPDAE